MAELQEPQGISFFNVKSGETHYAKLEPTIAAYINSSDMGINASRGQDYGWKLGVDWVKRVKAFRRDPMQMQMLSARNQGQKPNTVQILYYLYGQELAAFQEEAEENENPYEEQYQRDIATGANQNQTPSKPAALADFEAGEDDDDDIADLIDDAITEDDDEEAAPPATPPASAPEPAKPENKPAAAKAAAKPTQK